MYRSTNTFCETEEEEEEEDDTNLLAVTNGRGNDWTTETLMSIRARHFNQSVKALFVTIALIGSLMVVMSVSAGSFSSGDRNRSVKSYFVENTLRGRGRLGRTSQVKGKEMSPAAELGNVTAADDHESAIKGNMSRNSGNGSDAASVFVAVRDLFAYESRILNDRGDDAANASSSSSSASNNNSIKEENMERNYERENLGARMTWQQIRGEIELEVKNDNKQTKENARKLFLFVRHGEAAHNVWGERQAKGVEIASEKVPCKDEVTEKSLLDPSLTQLGLHEATQAGKALKKYLNLAIGDGGEKDVRFFTSSQARAIETARVAVLQTSEVRKRMSSSIKVSDAIRNTIDLSVPFEIRRPYSFEDVHTGDPIQYGGLSRAIAKRDDAKYLQDCEFTKTIRDITEINADDDFSVNVEPSWTDKKCRLGESTFDSAFICQQQLGLIVENDGELRYESNEVGDLDRVRDRIRVWFANVFEEVSEKVVVAVVHSDVIESVLREAYGDDMKSEYDAKNGDIVPVLVKDMRPKETLSFWNETDY